MNLFLFRDKNQDSRIFKNGVKQESRILKSSRILAVKNQCLFKGIFSGGTFEKGSILSEKGPNSPTQFAFGIYIYIFCHEFGGFSRALKINLFEYVKTQIKLLLGSACSVKKVLIY